jgi:hypothetical protein
VRVLAIGLASALLTALTGGGQPALAAPPRPIDLHVLGGDGWHADNSFDLQWTNPPADGSPLSAVHYRIRDPLGTPVTEARLGRVTDGLAALSIPPIPGSYSAEVWLEDAAGTQGPPAAAALRFDDGRPGPVAAPQVLGWIGRTAFPLALQLGHPAGPVPVSGIRGYLVSIDRVPDGSPCSSPDGCEPGETSLAGGVGDDTVAISGLPEGTSYLHAVAVSGAGVRSSEAAHATLRVDTTDPQTSLEGIPDGWANDPVTLTAHAADAGSGMKSDGFGPLPITAIRVDGAATSSPGQSVAVTVFEDGVHAIEHFARDAAGNVNDGGHSNGVAHRPPSAALLRIDRAPPNIAFANSQDPLDPELIQAKVSDPLSGADLSHGWIELRKAGSGDAFQPLPAAPAVEGELRARWTSDAYPAGDYEFRAIGFDTAGNVSATTLRANGSPMLLSNPLKLTTALLAAFGGRTMTWHRCTREGARRRCRRETIASLAARPASRTVPYGRGLDLGGRLLAAGGVVPAGRPVEVVERFAPGTTQPPRTTTVRTDSGGYFSLHLVPGPSREIVTSFPGDAALSGSTSRSLRLRVRTGVTLRASSPVAAVGGAPLVFRGRVRASGEEIPAAGVAVQLQFSLPGAPWSEFRTVRTDGAGSFRYAYRFSDDDSRGVRFRFRGFVPSQIGWPYEPGASPPVAVLGR